MIVQSQIINHNTIQVEFSDKPKQTTSYTWKKNDKEIAPLEIHKVGERVVFNFIFDEKFTSEDFVTVSNKNGFMDQPVTNNVMPENYKQFTQ